MAASTESGKQGQELEDIIEQLEEECKTAIYIRKKIEWEKASLEKNLNSKLKTFEVLKKSNDELENEIKSSTNKIKDVEAAFANAQTTNSSLKQAFSDLGRFSQKEDK